MRIGDLEFTGIEDLKGLYPESTAVICCSGTTLKEYDDARVPASWPRFAVNEAIRKLGERASFWVLSDDPIVLEYGALCPATTKVLCMHEATKTIRRHVQASPIYTVQSVGRLSEVVDGYAFYSRGTVLIGAVEMARYMGFTRFFVFGLDCYRLRTEYYYDGRRPLVLSENTVHDLYKVRKGVPPEAKLYVTPRLKNMREKLDFARSSGLWDDIEIYCVGSPWSQQDAIPKLSWDEFERVAHPGMAALAEQVDRDILGEYDQRHGAEDAAAAKALLDAAPAPRGTMEQPRLLARDGELLSSHPSATMGAAAVGLPESSRDSKEGEVPAAPLSRRRGRPRRDQKARSEEVPLIQPSGPEPRDVQQPLGGEEARTQGEVLQASALEVGAEVMIHSLEGFGGAAVVLEVDPTKKDGRHKVRMTESGQEFWAWDHEIDELAGRNTEKKE